MRNLKGKPVSQGIAIGKAAIFKSNRDIIFKEHLEKSLVPKELERFNRALETTKLQLKSIYKNLQEVMGKDSSLIIESQSMLLNDSRLVDEIREKISGSMVNSEWAVNEVSKKYVKFFNNIKDLSFREKGNDIADILGRITENLSKNNKDDNTDIENVIIIANDLTPTTAASLMSKGKLLGIVLNNGGETSHTVILARTLGIPTILETGNATEKISNDDILIVDGLTGEIIVNPGEDELSEAQTKIENFKTYKERLKELINIPNVTRDNRNFNLMANIELPFESELVHSSGASGIGLFRTEFLFMDPEIALSEDEQYLIYKNIAQKVYPDEVTIRTFDIGRDKGAKYFRTGNERNPALGTMAIRLFVKEQKILKIQIKSIIRANENGNIKILFPMITEIEEIRIIKKIIREMSDELKKEDKLPDNIPEIGIMIEIPGAVKLIKHLKNDIDFFSVGTNDLIQYLLAVERDNSSLSYLFNPFQPSVIESLFEIRREADLIGKSVTVCGEIAGKPITALMLLGMGYTNFSMNPLSVAEIKRVFINIELSKVRSIVNKLVSFGSKSESEDFLRKSLNESYPNLFTELPVF